MLTHQSCDFPHKLDRVDLKAWGGGGGGGSIQFEHAIIIPRGLSAGLAQNRFDWAFNWH
jgi:hypothetical protein